MLVLKYVLCAIWDLVFVTDKLEFYGCFPSRLRAFHCLVFHFYDPIHREPGRGGGKKHKTRIKIRPQARATMKGACLYLRATGPYFMDFAVEQSGYIFPRLSLFFPLPLFPPARKVAFQTGKTDARPFS